MEESGDVAQGVWDVCVIGGGPFSLVRSIEELEAGRSVLVVDAQPFLGGAWATRRCYEGATLGYDAVAHLLSVYPPTYALLEQCGFVMRERRLYFWDAAYGEDKDAALVHLADDAFTPTSTPAGHVMGYHQYYAAQAWPDRTEVSRLADVMREEFRSFRYLEFSFQPVIDALVERFRDLGGRTALGATVSQVEITPDGVTAIADGRAISAEKLISGRHLDCPLTVNGETPHEPAQQNNYNSLMVRARLPVEPRCRYVNVVNHRQVQAVQIAPCPRDADVYSFCIILSWHDAAATPDALAAATLGELRRAGVFLGDAAVIEARFHHYVSYSHSTAFLESVEAMSPRLEINIVDNMSECITRNADAWRRALTPGAGTAESPALEEADARSGAGDR